MSQSAFLPYYRGDSSKGITPPNLAVESTIPEHIVRARGKKTNFTSVSLDKDKVKSFGDAIYTLLNDILHTDMHKLIEHKQVLESLRTFAKGDDPKQKDLALRAIPRAKSNLEGLIRWNFKIPSDVGGSTKLISWVSPKVQKYFDKLP